ncbi:MAG: lipopolysaccharide heptosyltransferase I [Burkholderiales bacterium]|nr:lipopolysaccharide heptosyltransferase I [Burkholderiales bacterium]
MRVLIVKLSSLGDVVHAMPVVHDIHSSHLQAEVDWVVEPAFAPMVKRIQGVTRVIECPLRRWRKGWWKEDVRKEWRAFQMTLSSIRYDAVLDLQGLIKSAVVARMANGPTFGLANRTDGSSYERPAGWLVDHAIHVEPRIHAVDRSRVLAAQALGHRIARAPTFRLRVTTTAKNATTKSTLVFVHGTSRDDKLWPEADWIELGRRAVRTGWRVALPQAGATEQARARRIALAIGEACEVWPTTTIDQMIDHMGCAGGVIGVDSGLSHIAVALGLPHVQIYNFPTSWRTGPHHGDDPAHQTAIEGQPSPSVDAVWGAWCQMEAASRATVPDIGRSEAADAGRTPSLWRKDATVFGFALAIPAAIATVTSSLLFRSQGASELLAFEICLDRLMLFT